MVGCAAGKARVADRLANAATRAGKDGAACYVFHLTLVPDRVGAACRAGCFNLERSRSVSARAWPEGEVGYPKYAGMTHVDAGKYLLTRLEPLEYRRRRWGVDYEWRRRLLVVGSIEFFEARTADRLMVAAGRATQRGASIKVDEAMVGNRPELPGAFDAGAVDSSDL